MSGWLITGASGLLGTSLCADLVARGERVVGVRHRRPIGVAGVVEITADLGDAAVVAEMLAAASPSVVLHAAGITNVDACERDEPLAAHIHGHVTGVLARAAEANGCRFVHISTDHLWDGTVANVGEDEPPRPMNAYARTKLLGEVAAVEASPSALVVRTNFFGDGPPWRPSFSDWAIAALTSSSPVRAFEDVHFTPMALRHLCEALVDLVALGASGVVHVAGGQRLSKLAFVQMVAALIGSTTEIVPTSVGDADLAAPRPVDMSLDCSRAVRLLSRPMPDVAAGLATLACAHSRTDPSETAIGERTT